MFVENREDAYIKYVTERQRKQTKRLSGMVNFDQKKRRDVPTFRRTYNPAGELLQAFCFPY